MSWLALSVGVGCMEWMFLSSLDLLLLASYVAGLRTTV